MADTTAAAAPVSTPFYLQPALWIALLTPLCALLSAKLGVTLDAATIASVLLPVAALVFGLLHHSATVTAAQITAHGVVTAAAAQAAASTPATAAAALGKV